MLVTHYLHRLPSDYDMERVLARAAARGPLWDRVEGLVFKAFMYQLRGVNGSNRNSYASLYLWQQINGLIDFIGNDRFRNVVSTFGRPQIEAWVPVSCRRGRAAVGRCLTIETHDIPVDSDVGSIVRAEEQALQIRLRDDVIFASIVALDLARWRIVRIAVRENLVEPGIGRLVFSIAYFAAPGIGVLPQQEDDVGSG